MGLLNFENVSKSFGEGTHRTEVLRDINLEVQEGEFLVLLGFSGTGKTTLINLMAGLQSPRRARSPSRASRSMAPAPSAALSSRAIR